MYRCRGRVRKSGGGRGCRFLRKKARCCFAPAAFSRSRELTSDDLLDVLFRRSQRVNINLLLLPEDIATDHSVLPQRQLTGVFLIHRRHSKPSTTACWIEYVEGREVRWIVLDTNLCPIRRGTAELCECRRLVAQRLKVNATALKSAF